MWTGHERSRLPFLIMSTDGSSLHVQEREGPAPPQPTVRYARKIPLTQAERERLALSVQESRPRMKSRLPLLIALIVVIIMAVTAAAWYLHLRSSEDNGPEGTVRDMIDAMNRRDGQDYVEQTTIVFETPGFIAGEIADLEQDWAESNTPELRIISLELLTVDELPSEVVQRFENVSDLIERAYSVGVEEYCGIHYQITAASGGGAVLEGNIPLFKINSVWYVDLFFDPWTP